MKYSECQRLAAERLSRLSKKKPDVPLKKSVVPLSKESSKSLKDITLERIREKVRLARAQHHAIKQDYYIGKFLVRGRYNSSVLDSIADGSVEVNPYPEGRLLSGWMHLHRFYKLCRAPIVAKLQKGKASALVDPIWRIIYPCSFFVTITQSPEGMRGSHTLILWYSSSFKKNFAIAASTFDGKFDRHNVDEMVAHIKHLRLTQSFFQNQNSEQAKFPL